VTQDALLSASSESNMFTTLCSNWYFQVSHPKMSVHTHLSSLCFSVLEFICKLLSKQETAWVQPVWHSIQRPTCSNLLLICLLKTSFKCSVIFQRSWSSTLILISV